MNTKLSTNFTLNSLKRALTPEDSNIQKDSKINSSTRQWFLDAFDIDVNNSFNKSPIFKVADYKNKPSTTFFRMLIKIITFGLSERLFDKNTNKQYLDKTTAFLTIKDKIDEAFKSAENGNTEVKFDIELDGITKKIKLTEDDGSVKIDVYHDGNGKLYASTKISQCTLDNIKTSITNESIKLDKVKDKDKFNERIECNKLSRKNKQSYLKLSEGNKKSYGELNKEQKEMYLKLSEGNKKYYDELNEEQKEMYLKLSDEHRVSCDKLKKKYKEVYMFLDPYYKNKFFTGNLIFKNRITEMRNDCIKEYSNAKSDHDKENILNKYDKMLEEFYKDS
jgi:hypothetical protein